MMEVYVLVVCGDCARIVISSHMGYFEVPAEKRKNLDGQIEAHEETCDKRRRIE
jgi:hypothetical protein